MWPDGYLVRRYTELAQPRLALRGVHHDAVKLMQAALEAPRLHAGRGVAVERVGVVDCEHQRCDGTETRQKQVVHQRQR